MGDTILVADGEGGCGGTSERVRVGRTSRATHASERDVGRSAARAARYGLALLGMLAVYSMLLALAEATDNADVLDGVGGALVVRRVSASERRERGGDIALLIGKGNALVVPTLSRWDPVASAPVTPILVDGASPSLESTSLSSSKRATLAFLVGDGESASMGATLRRSDERIGEGTAGERGTGDPAGESPSVRRAIVGSKSAAAASTRDWRRVGVRAVIVMTGDVGVMGGTPTTGGTTGWTVDWCDDAGWSTFIRNDMGVGNVLMSLGGRVGARELAGTLSVDDLAVIVGGGTFRRSARDGAESSCSIATGVVGREATLGSAVPGPGERGPRSGDTGTERSSLETCATVGVAGEEAGTENAPSALREASTRDERGTAGTAKRPTSSLGASSSVACCGVLRPVTGGRARRAPSAPGPMPRPRPVRCVSVLRAVGAELLRTCEAERDGFRSLSLKLRSESWSWSHVEVLRESGAGTSPPRGCHARMRSTIACERRRRRFSSDEGGCRPRLNMLTTDSRRSSGSDGRTGSRWGVTVAGVAGAEVSAASCGTALRLTCDLLEDWG
jgi:hypothetical protein